MWDYWAKADSEGAFHALPYHQLDVAAVGVALLKRHQKLRCQLIGLSGLPESLFDRWIAFFLALHDLGKFSSNFQLLRPELAPAHCRQLPSTLRHDSLGHILWQEKTGLQVIQSGSLVRCEHSEDLEELFEVWILAVTGHHGQPPKSGNHPLPACFAPEDLKAASEFVIETSALLLPGRPPHFTGDLSDLINRSRPFSWWLAGFSVLADWLGSNRAYFPYKAQPMPLASYWYEVASEQADRAIDECGLLPVQPAATASIQKLFPGISKPTPLQAFCGELSVGETPELFILEDVTGSGKTEAAFVLLNRLLSSGVGAGAYFALPTMATSNAMYGRTAAVYRQLFDNRHGAVSLILAHGGRNLDERFSASVLPHSPDQGEYQPGESDAGARCNAWLADGNKRALLAQMGVGTIDQALLAILTSRHQSLRLLGLGSKVLLVDEVHASDAYMHRLLCCLLEFHAYGGGSAILLSATLPSWMRQELGDAFRRGLGAGPWRLSRSDYPLVSRINHSGSKETPVETRDQGKRSLEFTTVSEPSEVLRWVVEQAKAGHCVVWIRNTVGDAVEARLALAEELQEDDLELFHARFAMADRLAIENRVLAHFGPNSTRKERAGRVLVATQVVEQSLDLDFDCMVSDLAPIDLLLQRAGRLKRHARDAFGNRLPAGIEDERGPATLHVLAPDTATGTDKRWIGRLLPGTAAVYPDHSRLWLTAWLIRHRRHLAIPDELRSWIEDVFSTEPATAVPDALAAIGRKTEGERRGDSATAKFNAIRLEDGYEHRYGEWWDESHTPTRLGEPTVVVRLARWDGRVLKPWSDAAKHPWLFSEVRLRRALLAEAVKPANSLLKRALDEVRDSWSASAEHTVLLPLAFREGAWHGSALNERGQNVEIIYDNVRGLVLEWPE